MSIHASQALIIKDELLNRISETEFWEVQLCITQLFFRVRDYHVNLLVPGSLQGPEAEDLPQPLESVPCWYFLFRRWTWEVYHNLRYSIKH